MKSNQIENFQWKEEDYVEIIGPELEFYLYLRGMDVIQDKENLKLIIASNITVEIDYTPGEKRGYTDRKGKDSLAADYASFKSMIHIKRGKW